MSAAASEASASASTVDAKPAPFSQQWVTLSKQQHIELVMQARSCKSLHELTKLHREAPEQVRALLDGDGDITRAALKAARSEPQPARERTESERLPHPMRHDTELACARLERALDELAKAVPSPDKTWLDGLKKRLAGIAGRLP